MSKTETFHTGPLYKLLSERLPQFKAANGSLSIPKLVEALDDVARFTVYRWMNGENISIKNAKKLVELSGDNLKLEELLPFMTR